MDIETLIDAALKSAKTLAGKYQVEAVQVNGSGYAEPGYKARGPVALGNWNDISERNDKSEYTVVDDVMSKLGKDLEAAGAELEWSDEWSECGECNKLVRTQPDCYGWIPSWAVTVDHEVRCHECLRKDPQEYLESLEGNLSNAVTFDLNLHKAGYRRLPLDLENGWYGGQADDPKVIGKSLRDLRVKRFLFKIDDKGQFDMKFSVWVHKDEHRKAKAGIKKVQTQGADPADALRTALQTAPMLQAKDGGVMVTKIHGDGTATSREVSAQNFIDGKALD